MNQKIAVVFFSGTHVTEEYAGTIRDELVRRGAGAQLVNATAFSARTRPLATDAWDAFLFGAPVYADFPPSVLDEWIPAQQGDGKPCAVFVTYGGRTSGHAPYHMFRMLTAAGFRVRLSAEFLGRHTFNLAGWTLMADRPNEADFAVAREYAAQAVARFDPSSKEAFSLQKTFGYDQAVENRRGEPAPTERRWCQPVRWKECSLCGRCAEECPAQAMDLETGESDPKKCIECLHCMYVCPEQALKADDRMRGFYPAFLKEWGMTEEILSRKQSKIIAAGHPAAS
jgi:ferredoxin